MHIGREIAIANTSYFTDIFYVKVLCQTTLCYNYVSFLFDVYFIISIVIVIIMIWKSFLQHCNLPHNNAFSVGQNMPLLY